MAAVDAVIKALQLDVAKCVIMLEPGPVVPPLSDDDSDWSPAAERERQRRSNVAAPRENGLETETVDAKEYRLALEAHGVCRVELH